MELLEMARMTVFGSKTRGEDFVAERDIPPMPGKVILITGAAGDIGRECATALARHARPARIYIADLAPRDGEAAKKALAQRILRDAYGDGSDPHPRTEMHFFDMDLGSFESVRRCAAAFAAREARLDVLVLNAGIIRVATGTTVEGYESHFGINYLGHALLARLLVPLMLETVERQKNGGGGGGSGRLVVVASEGHAMAPAEGILFDRVGSDCADLSYFQRYGQSKLALMHLARQLAQRHAPLTVASVHPGRVNTGMGEALGRESTVVRLARPFAAWLCTGPAEGARNHLWAATSPRVVSGKYYEPVGVPDREATASATDDALGARLWAWTEERLGRFVRPL